MNDQKNMEKEECTKGSTEGCCKEREGESSAGCCKNQGEKVTADSNARAEPASTKKTCECGAKLCTGKCNEYKAGWQRALADYENLKQDMVKSAAESRYHIKSSLAHELLPVMDNFDQAVEHAPETDDKKINSWLQGVTFIKQQFEQVFVEMGLEQVDTSEAFDPHLHEAVEESEDGDGEAGTIQKVISSGWKIGETVIRPAKVIVKK